MNTPHWLEFLLNHKVPLLLQQSADAAALALLAALVIAGFRRRLSAAWRHGLWLLVFMRLLLPGLPVVPVKAPSIAAKPAEARLIVSPPISITSANPAPTSHPPSVPATSLPADRSVDVQSLAFTLWWLIACVLILLGLARSWTFHRRLRRGSVSAPEPLVEMLAEVGQANGLTRVPEIRICSAMKVPALAGWWRPRLLLPENFADRITEDRLRLVLAHELAHWRRGDLWWQLFTSLLLALHWFNPLLWVARYRLREEAEAACDEWVLRRIGADDARVYGDTLLHIGEWLPATPRHAPGVVGMAMHASGLRRRIVLVGEWMRGRRASTWCGVLGFALLTALGLVRAAEPKAEIKPSPQWHAQVKFHVFDEATKAPLSGVKLSEESGKHRHETTTDANGMATVVLPAARPNWASVRFQTQGRVPMVLHWSFEQPEFQLPEMIEFPLPKAATIGGIVLDEKRKPVTDAKVVLIMRGSSMGGAAQQIFADVWERRVTTDKEGRWSFNEAPPLRRFSLAVEHPEIVRTTSWLDQDQAAAFYQGKGETRVRHGLKITGNVVDLEGHPVKATLVWGESGSGSTTFPEYKTDDTGRFVISNAPNGHREVVTVFAKGKAPEVLVWNTRTLKSPVTIRIGTGKRLRVRVVDPDGKPLAGVIGASDTWFGQDSGDRGLRVMNHRFVTDKEGRFTWEQAPTAEVSWDFFGLQGYRDSRNVSITPLADEVVVKMFPPSRVLCLVTDAETQAPITEFHAVVGFANKVEEAGKPKSFNYNWWNPSRLKGVKGRLDFDLDVVGRHTPRVLRISAPGYRPVISEPFDDDNPVVTWNAALKKTEPLQVRVLQPDGSPAAGAKIASTNVTFGKVQMQRGDLPAQDWPDGDAAFVLTDADGIATVQPEDERFGFIVVHPTGWGRLVNQELPVLNLHAWASLEIDLNGLPPSLRTSLTLMRNIPDDGISLVEPDLRKPWPNNLYRDDYLLAADYQLQLISDQATSAPILLHLEPGEHRKLDAGSLWRWMKLQGRVEVPKGARLAKTQVDLLLGPVPEEGHAGNVVQIRAQCEPASDGGWQITFDPVGLATGTYQIISVIRGWLAGVPDSTDAGPIGSVQATFTITSDDFNASPAKFELVPKSSGQLLPKTDNAPIYQLPMIHVK
jgi:beta-lactamase regulating signal transducer with metallopeptidase domain